MESTHGNSFRHNNLETINSTSVLCICDEATSSYCEQLSVEFINKIPFGYMGVAPWFGLKTYDKRLQINTPCNLNITDLFFRQNEVAVVVYMGETQDAYIEYCKKLVPSAKHIIFDAEKDDIKELMAECYKSVGELKNFPDSTEREPAEWFNLTFSDDKGGKRLLLVGDSISKGYFKGVKSLLPAYTVDTLNTSEGIEHQNIYDELLIALQYRRYDTVHINIGLHTHDVTLDGYKEGLKSVFSFIRTHAAQAEIIFANTTTINKAKTQEKYDNRQFRYGDRNPVAMNEAERNSNIDKTATEFVMQLNRQAEIACTEHQVRLNDLFRLCVEENLEKTDTVHFTAESYMVLAKRIAQFVMRQTH